MGICSSCVFIALTDWQIPEICVQNQQGNSRLVKVFCNHQWSCMSETSFLCVFCSQQQDFMAAFFWGLWQDLSRCFNANSWVLLLPNQLQKTQPKHTLQIFVPAAVQMQIWKLIYDVTNLLCIFSSLVRLSKFFVFLFLLLFFIYLCLSSMQNCLCRYALELEWCRKKPNLLHLHNCQTIELIIVFGESVNININV